jgi:hypothetical protein
MGERRAMLVFAISADLVEHTDVIDDEMIG